MRTYTDSHHVTSSIAEYIHLNALRTNTPAKLSNGRWSYLIDNEWVSTEVFEAARPPYEYRKFNSKGQRVGKNAYLY